MNIHSLGALFYTAEFNYSCLALQNYMYDIYSWDKAVFTSVPIFIKKCCLSQCNLKALRNVCLWFGLTMKRLVKRWLSLIITLHFI